MSEGRVWRSGESFSLCTVCSTVVEHTVHRLTAEQIAHEWNAHHPNGTPVRYWSGERTGEGRRSATRSWAWVLPSGEPVVQVVGHAGAIALTHVQPEDVP